MAALLPGTWAVTNTGDAEVEAFGAWLDANRQSVSLLTRGAGDSIIFQPGVPPSELVVFQVHLPVEWTLSPTPVPFHFPKEERSDAEPGAVEPESPGKGLPAGADFGGGQEWLGWAILLGVYIYYTTKGNR